MTSAQVFAIALVVLPALAFVAWPLARRRDESADGVRNDSDRRLELEEEKTAIYRALRELGFDHEAGHLSDEDYQALRDRYEGRAAEVLAALDALAPAPVAETPGRPEERAPAVRPSTSWTRHPVTFVIGGVTLVLFGVVLGVNAGRFSERETPMSPPADAAATPSEGSPGGMPPMMGGGSSGKAIPPEILAGMLRAARQSLNEGRYSEAIAAYQAVLKRDPKNIDAMTHLGLIVAIGGHADAALETFDKALAIDPQYAPAYLYRGQVLYDVKADYPGAVKAWERYLALVPSGEEHDRVAQLVKDARAKPAR
jgi:tetratricopeptide (TPR) repeat protein